MPGPNIKGARIALAGAAATTIFTDSDRFWNDKTHDVAKAATYLEEPAFPGASCYLAYGPSSSGTGRECCG